MKSASQLRHLFTVLSNFEWRPGEGAGGAVVGEAGTVETGLELVIEYSVVAPTLTVPFQLVPGANTPNTPSTPNTRNTLITRNTPNTPNIPAQIESNHSALK